MRIVIDADLCDGHALCESIAPSVFTMGADERAHLTDVAITPALMPAIREAVLRCPCRAILLEEAVGT
jgi:ferredoxin